MGPDYNDVKELGALVNSTRTTEQTDIAHFWNANYLVVWNQALRDIAASEVSGIGRTARLFALANMAMTDAVISAWNAKTTYLFWRPVTAIQEGDRDGNSRTAGNPTWQPLIPTPPYPDYTSGANNVTGAATRILRLFFGTDRMTFSVTTNNTVPTRKTRSYNRFTDAAAEVVRARVYEGIHFAFADEQARAQGESVANWTFRNYLQPVGREFSDPVEKNDDGERRVR
jgi:hypothetical protein